ncbi:MAG: hypothetical protein FWF54_04930 [Candidatus Azobacteroides sp.]|nr:hypothetical protein [Candidatus Azobacteroides sp.]
MENMNTFNHKNILKKTIDNLLTHYPVFFLLIFLLFACGNNEEKARKLLETAREYSDKNDFGAAKLQIDSIKILYPKELSVIKEGNVLTWKIELKEQERSLIYLDSMLIVNKQMIDSLKKTLIFEKDKEYQTYGIYLDKNQTVERTIGQSCLKFQVNEIGEMSMAATVYGRGKGTFNAVKAETDDGKYVETPALPKDDGNNYVFTDGGVSTQILNFIRKKDNGFIDFLYTYRNNPLKITYSGSVGAYSYSLTRNEKEALNAIYQLSAALSNTEKLNTEIKAAQAKIEFCKQAGEFH